MRGEDCSAGLADEGDGSGERRVGGGRGRCEFGVERGLVGPRRVDFDA